MCSKLILLVDDDVEFVGATRALLEAEGYEIAVAHGGADGLEIARTLKPNLIILDVMMSSDTEGIETSKTLQSIPELGEIPIILMTGIRRAMSLPFGLEPDAERLPVGVVLEKPVPPDLLLAEVKKQLG